MGVVADRLDAMVVQAEAPGGRISAKLRDRTQVELSFEPGSYRHLDERWLERQLAAVAALLWAGRMKVYHAARSEAFGMPLTGESPPATARDREYDVALEGLVAEGRAADGSVSVSVRGMRSWAVHIAPGTLQRLDEDAFVERVRAAAAALIQDQFAQVAQLKQRIYGE
jgi:hypothetical protein